MSQVSLLIYTDLIIYFIVNLAAKCQIEYEGKVKVKATP